MQLWQRYKDDEITDFHWRKVVVKYFKLPDGTEGDFVTDTWGHDNAAVVAITPEHKIVVATQFRTGPEKFLYELPGGSCDNGESPDLTAVRELNEETGYESNESPIFLGKICRNAYHNDDTYYYLQLNCRQTGSQQLDGREDIEVGLRSFEEMVEFAKQGLVSDPTAIFLARDKIKELEERNETTN